MPESQESRNAADIAVLGDKLTGLRSTVDELGLAIEAARGTIADQGAILGSLDGLATLVDELAQRFNAIFPPDDPNSGFYSPIPSPRFWQPEGTQRAQAIARLRAWVDQVYAPAFGHIAATLPECWESHPLILTLLDIASELHSCLYLQPRRNQGMLAGQAEYFTRIIPALADLMARDKAVCRQLHSTDNGQVRGVAAWRLINQAAIAAVLARHMPGATAIFITDSGGNRTVIAPTEPPEPVIADYRRRGHSVDFGQLKQAS